MRSFFVRTIIIAWAIWKVNKTLSYSISNIKQKLCFANLDEAALMKKLSDSLSSFLAGSLLIATRSEGVGRSTLSKESKNNEVYI